MAELCVGGAAQIAIAPAELGMHFLAQSKPEIALLHLRKAVETGDRRPSTLLNLALAEDAAGEQGRADGLITLLQDQFPEWDEPILRAAERLRRAGKNEDAAALYRRVLTLNPVRPEALISLAVLHIQAGAYVEAQSLLLRCCGSVPDRAEAWDALGFALLGTKDYEAAASAFFAAQRLEPTREDFALHHVAAAFEAGSGEAELARLECASDADPLNAALLIARGDLLGRLGRWDAAVDVLEAAVTLAPDSLRAAEQLGDSLAAARDQRGAESAFRRAMALNPDNAEIQQKLAVVLIRLQRHAEAVELLRGIIERHGERSVVLSNLAAALNHLGQQEEAEATARRAIAVAPNAIMGRRTLCNTLPYRSGIGGMELLEAARCCSEQLPREPGASFSNRRAPGKRLRVGLLSGTLRVHPVGWLTIAGFEALDPAAFELVAFPEHTFDDVIARRFRAIAAEWHPTGGLDDGALAARIRALGIDILIDLGGYGDLGRMTVCARRVAPVQIKWVGMQNHSTGMPEMDWFITDRWETPDGFERFYSERLLRMPEGYVCYSPPPDAPDVEPLPALARGHITFGCFNNLAKITPQVIATWSRILHRVPDARLMLKAHQFGDPSTSAAVLAAFATHDIPPERLSLSGGSPHRTLLQAYGQVDIVLDPFPYAGGLTTCEALWMGCPTIALPGEIFASRHATSHLSNVGLTDWIARDLDHYVELAEGKTRCVSALAELRAGLRNRVKASPLCDAPRFGPALGAALRHTWQAWCEEH
jgi:protein O-GlcNAc transferase